MPIIKQSNTKRGLFTRLVKRLDKRPTHLKMLRAIESALHVFQEANLNRRIEAMVETKVVSFLESGDREAVKYEETPVHQVVKNVVLRAFPRGIFNENMHMKVDNLSDSQDYVQQFMLNLVKELSITVALNRLVENDGRASFADEAKFYNQGKARANQA